MKRKISVITIAFVLMLTLSVTAFASSGNDDTFNILDGIGGFFRDMINGIGEGISYLLDGIKRLFVPEKETFSKFRDNILNKFDEKFGSLFSAVKYLQERFSDLRGKSGMDEVFKIVFPRSSFMSGSTLNLLPFMAPVLAFVKLVATGGLCLFTFLTFYHRILDMINT